MFALSLNEKEKFPESTGNKALSGNFSWQREKDSNPHKQSQSQCAKKLKVAVALCVRATEKFLSTIFPTTPV